MVEINYFSAVMGRRMKGKFFRHAETKMMMLNILHQLYLYYFTIVMTGGTNDR